MKRARTETRANNNEAAAAAPAEEGAMPTNMEVATEKEAMHPPLELPSNATSIRAEITDTFSCENRGYGYYADVENECQIFHVCLPVMYDDVERKERTFRWSFICPEETVFSQVVFTCVRMEDMPNECQESEQYYKLNQNFGMTMNESAAENEMKETEGSQMQQQMMLEKIEMTTEGKKMVMEEKRPAAAMEMAGGMKVRPQSAMNSNAAMTEGLLPPLANEVYRAGTNGEAQMPQDVPVAMAVMEGENNVVETELDEVKEVEDEEAIILETKSQNSNLAVIEAVDNIVRESEAAAAVAAATPEMRRMPDPRGRRFLFRADVKRN